MRQISAVQRLNSFEGEKLPFKSYFKIDNTNIAPADAAKLIKNYFKI